MLNVTSEMIGKMVKVVAAADNILGPKFLGQVGQIVGISADRSEYVVRFPNGADTFWPEEISENLYEPAKSREDYDWEWDVDR